MATDPMLLDDEDYASDQDSDFAPDDGALGGGGGNDDDDDDADNTGDDSDSEDDGTDAATPRGHTESLQNTAAAAAAVAGIAGTDSPSSTRKRNSGGEGDGFENSGDEAVIQKGQKKLSRKQAKKNKTKGTHGGAGNDEEEEDDEGGEGGLVKTRAMRAAEKSERRDRGVVPSGPVTIDVDDMWARMMSGAEVLPASKSDGDVEGAGETGGSGGDKEKQQSGSGGDDDDTEKPIADKNKSADGSSNNSNTPAMIKIKRTYNFAGKVHTEEKLVARDSAEAKLYMASLDPKSAEYIALTSGTTEKTSGDNDDDGESAQLRRPRKAFRSIFEPVLLDASGQQQQRRRADLNLGLSAALQQREASFRLNGGGKAKKLNVVEKSRMDWAGFVDKEGIKDDLELAGRSKQSYAHRQDFLSRVEMNREDEARRARLAGRT